MALKEVINSFPLVLLLFVQFIPVNDAIDTSVCRPNAPNSVQKGPALPTLPTTFTARVECNLLTQNKTTDVIEYYDSVNNRGAVLQTDQGTTGKLIYDYDTNEMFTITIGAADPCYVDELTEDNNDFLFGYKKENQSVRIFSPNAALRFGGKNVEKYLGRSVVRGVVVEGWESCSYWPGMDATSKVTWYFSDATAWTEAIGSDRLPVRCEITGKSHDSNGGTKVFHHLYEFTHFRASIDSTDENVFETPEGVFCKNRKSIKAVPMTPQFFKFEAEIVQEDIKIMSYIAEWYDYSSQLVRFDYTPFPSDALQFGVNPMTEIHDFNTGVRYVIDRKHWNCTPEVIDPTGFDADSVNPQTVRMRDSRQFFDLDATFEYEGMHTSEGVSCDTWIGKKTNFPPGFKSSNVEWFLSSNEWAIGAGNTFRSGIPKRMEISSSSDDIKLHFSYNIFSYDDSEPSVWDYDVTGCFPPDHQRHLQFSLPGSFKTLLQLSKQKFEYAIYKAITKYAVISPIRVSKLTVDYNEASIVVTFTMLGVAPIDGDASKGAIETSLYEAVNNFMSKVKSGQFIVSVYREPKPLTFTAHPYSAKSLKVREWLNNPIPPKQSGYSPGSMAAVGIMMLIVGLVTGCGAIVFIYRRNGGSFQAKTKQTVKSDVGPEEKGQEMSGKY